jgi:hypothetical protein
MAHFSGAAFAQRRVEARVSHENLCPVCDSANSGYVLTRNQMRLLRCQGCDLIRLEPRKKPSVGALPQLKPAQQEHVAGQSDRSLLFETLRSRLQKRGTASGVIRVGFSGPVAPDAQMTAARFGLELTAVGPENEVAPLASSDRPFDACIVAGWFERDGDPLSTLLRLRRSLALDGILAITLESFSAGSDAPGSQLIGSGTRFLYDGETMESLLFRAGFGRVEIARASAKAAQAVVTASKRYPEDQPRHRDKLSIIMPVFNEKATFLEVFELLHAKQLPDLDKEFIIVESNSTDGTKEDVRSIADRADVTVIWQETPRGKGSAVREGLAHASGDFVIIQDADLEYDIDDYDLLLDPLRHNRAAFVLGIRHGHHGDSWKMRHFEDQFAVSQVMNLGHLFFTALFNVVYQQRLTDPFTMFKVFRRDCIGGLTFECNRFDFDWELVAKLVRRGYLPIEIPVNYSSRSFAEGKKVTFFRDPLTWLRACIKYRLVKV